MPQQFDEDGRRMQREGNFYSFLPAKAAMRKEKPIGKRWRKSNEAPHRLRKS